MAWLVKWPTNSLPDRGQQPRRSLQYVQLLLTFATMTMTILVKLFHECEKLRVGAHQGKETTSIKRIHDEECKIPANVHLCFHFLHMMTHFRMLHIKFALHASEDERVNNVRGQNITFTSLLADKSTRVMAAWIATLCSHKWKQSPHHFYLWGVLWTSKITASRNRDDHGVQNGFGSFYPAPYPWCRGLFLRRESGHCVKLTAQLRRGSK